MFTRITLVSALLLLHGCAGQPPVRLTQPAVAEDNPPAPGFDSAGSDPRAVALADATMKAMGGRRAWDGTRYLSWRFFGTRLHVWDRFTGNVRIEYADRKTGAQTLILMNINSRTGRAFRDGREVVDRDELAGLLQRGLELWINDSYWLVMPYKLKDSGVTLRYRGQAALADGRPADVLVLTFAGVGVTPENKYDVYVARDTGLVEQWAFYKQASDEKPALVTPWRGWRRHGAILLSADRGPGKAHTDVAVFADLPQAVFTSPAPVDLRALAAV
jgi:hypothetical protein